MATTYTPRYFPAVHSHRRSRPSPPSFRCSSLTTEWSTHALTAEDNSRTPAVTVAPAKAQKFLKEDEGEKVSFDDYLEQAKVLIAADSGGGSIGPPRWLSPVECGPRIENSPLLLYLPGIDGLGSGLIMQQQKLAKIFDVWCLHIPVKDRTPFQELMLAVERTVRAENHHYPEKPIYLVGESLGACLALAVAARNPDIDLVLILSNPATCYEKSQLHLASPLLKVIPSELSLIGIPYIFNQVLGDPLEATLSLLTKGLQLDELTRGQLKLSSYLSVLADVIPKDTLLWRLQMMKTAASYVNSRIHFVKAQILLLASGRDPFFSSLDEAERIRTALPKQEIRVLNTSAEMPKCEIRRFNDSGHFLFLEDSFDLVAVIKGSGFYRRGKTQDYVSDYLPLTKSEFHRTCEPFRWIDIATGPVMLSTLEDGTIVRSVEGIPTDGPVVYVGYHMLLGLELYPLVMKFKAEKDIFLRGLAHPTVFFRVQEDQIDSSLFDSFRSMGAVPVSASNFYKLLASGSHVLLYPGGMREACHKKGEEYQLFWPERSEFVRMAARFGAKIVPFGVVGEDDIGELVFDYEDQMKIPYLKDLIEKQSDTLRLRTDEEGEVANQIGYFPGIIPKLPGRFYYLLGKPIDTAGMKLELRDRDKAHDLYLHVKSEVEHCISYLKENREKDPYRSLAARILYQATHGWSAEVPTFEI